MAYPHEWSPISYKSKAHRPKTNALPLDHATSLYARLI